jgi:DNA primase
MIARKSVDEVIETAKVEDVVGDYVTLKRRGSNLAGLCPFHNEKTPSFYVSPAKNIYKCFGCGEAGGPVQFLMQHEHMSFPEAIRHLAARYKIEIEETQLTDEARAEQQKRDSLFLVNQFAQEYFTDQLFNTDTGKSIGLSYFKNRGFSEETIKKFGLGYTQKNRDGFTQYALSKGYEKSLLQELGLTSQYDADFFRDRVMFTIRNLSGKVVAFAGRIMQKNVKAPKYINSPETEIYHKSKVLYGMYLAKGPIRKVDECIMVEGYTDVISLHQAGIENVVASSGTSLTVGQIGLVKRFTPNIKIIYDGDKAGIKAALRGLDLVLEQDLNVKIVLLPEGEDPDSYLQTVGPEVFKQYIEDKAQDFIFFKSDLLIQESERDPIKKANAIKDIVSSIARIPDGLKRSIYIRECAKITELEEDVLVDEVNKQLGIQLRNRKDQQQRAAQREAREQATEADIPPSAQADPLKNIARPKMSPDEYQERDIIRILLNGGDQYYEEDKGITIAQFILSNIDDIIEDFHDATFKEILQIYFQHLNEHRTPKSAYFVNHEQESIRNLALDLLSTPYEYSENWEKKHEIFLDQKRPEDNFVKDAELAVKRLRLKKIKKKMGEVRQLIQKLSEEASDEVMTYMKLYSKLKSMHDDIARDLNSVVL